MGRMVRRQSVTNKRRLTQIKTIQQQYPKYVAIKAGVVARQNAPDVLADLGYEPPPFRGGKREWESEKQRRAYFKTDGFGRGIPTKRTHKLSQGWRVNVLTEGDGVAIRVHNLMGYTEFVVGRLRARGRDRMQRMHIQGGWRRVAPIIDTWGDLLIEQTIADVQAVFNEPTR
jgi:hypothetical protein